MESRELFHIADKHFWDKIDDLYKEKGGVYKMIAVEDKKRITIKRFLGYDQSGVLYIGKATSFLDRVINLKKSISPNLAGTSHICGRRYKANPNIAIQFPFMNLYIELIQDDEPEELEKKLLKEYRITFGEVPPLNAI